MLLIDQGVHCVHDLGPAAVVDAEDEVEDRLVLRALLRPMHLLQKVRRQLIPPSAEADARPLRLDGLHLAPNVITEEAHQAIDLHLGPVPVLRGEGVDREVTNPLALDEVNHLFQFPQAGAMPHESRQPTALGPSSIAVQDNCQVPGHPSAFCQVLAHLLSPFPISSRRALSCCTSCHVRSLGLPLARESLRRR